MLKMRKHECFRIGRFYWSECSEEKCHIELITVRYGSKMKSGNTIRCHHFSNYYVLVTLCHQNTGPRSNNRPILNIISFRMNVIHEHHLLHEPKPISFQTSIHHSLVSDEYPKNIFSIVDKNFEKLPLHY